MYQIEIQRAVKEVSIPKTSALRAWAKRSLLDKIPAAELTIRIVDEEEMTQLNTTYRHKTGPTNVLSFPFDTPPEAQTELPLLGDIIICAEVIKREAIAQQKSAEAHWAHMVVHGVLHLLGYNHEIDAEAICMEAEETAILQALGFPNPYEIQGCTSS